MGKQDILAKGYLSQNNIFADAFNYLIYDGEPIIVPEELRELDPTEASMIEEKSTVFTNQKIRDILKSCTIKHGRHTTMVLLGIENQAAVHYAMPVRNFLYDALNYNAQVRDVRKRHRKKTDLKKGAELLSGYTKEDHLTPIITLCVCFSKEKWDAPRSLYDMFGSIDPQIRKFVNNYSLNLITPSEIEDFSKFSSELGIVLEFIYYSEDREKIRDIINSNERYRHVDNSSIDMINAFTDANISKAEAEGGQVNMCTAIKELIEEGREEGREEGQAMLADLILKLTPGTEDYMKALQGTSAEREKLYRKYGIVRPDGYNT